MPKGVKNMKTESPTVIFHPAIFCIALHFILKLKITFSFLFFFNANTPKAKSKNLPLIMVFCRKFLYGGRQKKYFHVKIFILVCLNRTSKKFENP